MQRYHFHFRWRNDAVFDEQGIELENFPAAYLHACELVHQVRRRFPAAGSDWWVQLQNADVLEARYAAEAKEDRRGVDTPTQIGSS